MGLPVSFADGDTPAGQALPAAQYECEVVKAVIKQVQSEESKHHGEDYIRLELRPLDVPDERFFSNLNFWPESKRFLMRDLIALGYDEADIRKDGFEVEPEDLAGRKCVAVVGIRDYNGEEQNEVKRLLTADGATTTSGAKLPT